MAAVSNSQAPVPRIDGLLKKNPRPIAGIPIAQRSDADVDRTPALTGFKPQ